MQDDSLVETATPREALVFSAKLRLPPDTSHEQIDELVEALLSELGITDCADTMIGGALIKGISGGQRKRTSVGIELITEPSLLFLDEPTSGLDSFSAFNLITQLRKVALNNTVILCTIHQPSSEVFFLFDIVIVLKDGRIFYQGPADAIVNHFSAFHYNCPDNYNPSDFVMSVCQTATTEELDERDFWPRNPRVEGDDQQPVKKNESQTVLADPDTAVAIKAPFSRQLQTLLIRDLRQTKRDIAALAGRFGVTVILNLIFGLIFLGAGNKDDSVGDNINAHFGGITFVAISAMFGTATPIMLSFPFERPIFMREYSTGTYTAVAYFISKMAMELPLAFIQAILQWIIAYFMIDLQGNWILLVLVSTL